MSIKLVKYWDKYTEMHGQQNVKIFIFFILIMFRGWDLFPKSMDDGMVFCSHVLINAQVWWRPVRRPKHVTLDIAVLWLFIV